MKDIDFWNSLSEEDKKLAFMAVTRLIKNNIIQERYSYYYFLEKILGFTDIENIHECYEDIHDCVVNTLERIEDRII